MIDCYVCKNLYRKVQTSKINQITIDLHCSVYCIYMIDIVWQTHVESYFTVWFWNKQFINVSVLNL